MMADVLDFNDAAPQADKPITQALAYAARGWPVFPCNPLNKRPLTEHGFKDATTDAFRIRAWWGQHPNAMIGIPTGAKSGFWVLDIDQGAGKTGVQSLAEMGHDLAELMDTAAANTASGGYHCLFRYDPERPVGNSRGALKRFLDVRGDGGYIIAAGSRRADGSAYEWLNPPDEMEIADAPEWLYAVIGEAPKAEGHGEFDFNTASKSREFDDLVKGIVSGDTYHDNLVSLAARLVGSNMHGGAAVSVLRGLMDAVPAERRDGRWLERYRDIPRTVATAEEKFGFSKPREAEPAQVPADRPTIPILSRSELRSLKRPQWLVDEVLVEASVVSIYGPSGSLKSFVALDLSMSVATSTPWHGHEVRGGPVVYVTGEGRDQINARLQAWETTHDYTDDAPIFVVPFGVPISDPAWVQLLITAIEQTGATPVMIWLDTLARTFGQGDENSQKDMNAFVWGVDTLRDHFRCVVGTVHHTGKDSDRGLRGSSALYAAMDTVIRTERKPGQMAVTLKNAQPHGKQKDASEFEDIVLQAKKVAIGTDEKGRQITSLSLGISGAEPSDVDPEERQDRGPGRPQGANQQAVMSALKRAKGEPLGLTRLAMMIGKDNSAATHAVTALVDKGLVVEVGDGGARKWRLA